MVTVHCVQSTRVAERTQPYQTHPVQAVQSSPQLYQYNIYHVMLNYLQKYYRPVSFICACTMLQSKKGPKKVNTVFSGRRSTLLVYLAIYSERCLTSLLRRMSTQLYIPKDVYTAIYSERCLPSNIFLRMPLPTQLYIPKHDYSAIYSEGCLPSYSIYSNNV